MRNIPVFGFISLYLAILEAKRGITFRHSKVNPRLTGTPDFSSPTGGGGGEHPPSIPAPIDRREKWKKCWKVRQKIIRELWYSQIFAQVEIVASRSKKCPKFWGSRDCRTTFRKTSNISGTLVARANRKTVFERELNLLSSDLTNVNGVASRAGTSAEGPEGTPPWGFRAPAGRRPASAKTPAKASETQTKSVKSSHEISAETYQKSTSRQSRALWPSGST